jgi:hypothetical protein
MFLSTTWGIFIFSINEKEIYYAPLHIRVTNTLKKKLSLEKLETISIIKWLWEKPHNVQRL